MTLLEKALAAAAARPARSPKIKAELREKIDLAIAYYAGKISSGDVATALQFPSTQAQARLASYVHQGLTRGIISISWVPNGFASASHLPAEHAEHDETGDK